MALSLAGVWKLGGIRKKMGKRRFPLCWGELGVKNILLSCSETGKWKAIFLNKKWLIMT
jgi:hypothetical protein